MLPHRCAVLLRARLQTHRTRENIPAGHLHLTLVFILLALPAGRCRPTELTPTLPAGFGLRFVYSSRPASELKVVLAAVKSLLRSGQQLSAFQRALGHFE